MGKLLSISLDYIKPRNVMYKQKIMINREIFLLEDKKKEIQDSFIKNGWITIYENSNADENQILIYCCIVDSKKIKSYKTNRNWEIEPGSEGKPSIYSTYKSGKPITTYQTYSEKGIEPFVFSKYFTFSDGHESYFDISEEFVLYFKLYEKGQNKQNRKFYFIDEVGDLDEVIKIEPNKITVKLKYLKEYISIRKVYFSICFDFMRLSNVNLQENDIQPIDEDFTAENYYYNHLIRHLDFIEAGQNQSWIHGKIFIPFEKDVLNNFHYSNDNRDYEKFITGYDIDGKEILLDCKKTNDKYFIVTYFKKEVLNKYYNEPTKYKVDGWRVSCSFFSLKIDNNIEDYVAVFLVELSSLPHKEQLHWKQYNISPQKGISNVYHQTMIEGNWVEHPETPDLFFKQKYETFNKDWEKKFGWKFYKELAKEDSYIFTSLHIPTSNNVKSFCEQILSLIKITIDRLNEAEFQKTITLDPKDRGITKLDKFLKSKDMEIPEMILFLKNLYSLRSGLFAHSFSSSNKECKKAIEYFNLNENNYTEVAKEIFIKSIYTLYTLENRLLKQ